MGMPGNPLGGFPGMAPPPENNFGQRSATERRRGEKPYFNLQQEIADGAEPKVFIGGLPPGIHVTDLQSYFSKFGKIVKAEVKMDEITGRNRGFGFITFQSLTSVEAVMQNWDSHQVNNKWIEVKPAIDANRRRQY